MGDDHNAQILRGIGQDLEAKYRRMLDPMFQERRFFFHAKGVQGFLGRGGTLGEPGRGEAVSGVSCTSPH